MKRQITTKHILYFMLVCLMALTCYQTYLIKTAYEPARMYQFDWVDSTIQIYQGDKYLGSYWPGKQIDSVLIEDNK